MAAFASTDVTVVVVERWWEGIKLHSRGTIAFGDGALTYATGGVALPAIAKFGMRRGIDVLDIVGLNGLTTDYVTRYDKTNHKLQLFQDNTNYAGGTLRETPTSETPAARTYQFYAIGS